MLQKGWSHSDFSISEFISPFTGLHKAFKASKLATLKVVKWAGVRPEQSFRSLWPEMVKCTCNKHRVWVLFQISLQKHTNLAFQQTPGVQTTQAPKANNYHELWAIHDREPHMKRNTGMGKQSNAKYNPNNLNSAPPFGTSKSKPAI